MPTATPQCPVCGSEQHRLIGTKGDLTLWACGSCGLGYTSPPPIERVLRKYRGEYDLAEHFGDWQARKRVLFERRLRRLPPPTAGRNRLIDVGCGDGQFLELARSHGWEGIGIDLNPPAVRRARQRGLHIVEGALEETESLSWGTFDVVTSWDTLEHTPYPRAFADRLRLLLAEPHGQLAITTVNLRSLAWKVFRTRWSLVVEDHFTYWDRDALLALFQPLGLRLTQYETVGLGRDFVAWVDALAARRQAEASAAPTDAAGGSNWDSKSGVLSLEAALNAVLRHTGGGVDVAATFRLD